MGLKSRQACISMPCSSNHTPGTTAAMEMETFGLF
jgi:hypothetical protein